jgi:AcrR family transcriptional regulator
MARPTRKDDILQAALACFTEVGVDATTIEMIRDRSGASIGSLYHHFGNKERIIAALYLAGTGQYAALLEQGFAAADSAEACIKLLVTSYIDWVAANPDWARFILHSRGRVEASELGEQLHEANRLHYGRIHQELAGYRAQGLFKAMPSDCFASVIIGPSHDFARNWLAGRTHTQLADCRELLAQVAWDSVKA